MLVIPTPRACDSLSQGQNPAVPKVWLQKTHRNWDFSDVFFTWWNKAANLPSNTKHHDAARASPQPSKPNCPQQEPNALRMGSCHYMSPCDFIFFVLSPPPPASASGAVRMKSAPELLRAGSDFTELQCRWINSSAAKSTWLNTGYITVFITVVWIGF